MHKQKQTQIQPYEYICIVDQPQLKYSTYKQAHSPQLANQKVAEVAEEAEAEVVDAYLHIQYIQIYLQCCV